MARGSIFLRLGFIITIVCISFSQPILWDVPKSFVAALLLFIVVKRHNNNEVPQMNLWISIISGVGLHRKTLSLSPCATILTVKFDDSRDCFSESLLKTIWKKKHFFLTTFTPLFASCTCLANFFTVTFTKET